MIIRNAGWFNPLLPLHEMLFCKYSTTEVYDGLYCIRECVTVVLTILCFFLSNYSLQLLLSLYFELFNPL